MPNLQTIRTGLAELPKGPPLVVALTGATSGIGSYIAKTLARTFAKHGSKLRVYIVGRNTSRAEPLLSYGRETSPGSEWRFVQVSDLSSISEVDSLSTEIIRQEKESPFTGGPARLDVLYMSQALSPLQPTYITTEGLDAQMTLLYYSRMRLIQNLTSLLSASPRTGHVISIFAGGMESNVNPSELLIGTPPPSTYGVTSIRNHTVFMKTFFFEELAKKYVGKVSFTHIYPGLVDGPVFYSDVNPLWFRIMWRVMKPLLSWYITNETVCGEVMVFLATRRYTAKGSVETGWEGEIVGGVAYSTQKELGGGAYGVGQRGDEKKQVIYEGLRKGDTAKKVWDHTVETLAAVERKNNDL